MQVSAFFAFWSQNSGHTSPKFTFSDVNSLSLPQWRYCIRLENLDSDVVQLRERHWRIFSLSGTLETVRGRGVVGRVSIIIHWASNAQFLVLHSRLGGLVCG